MSAVATFIRIAILDLPKIREAVVPKKGFFGGVKDVFHDTLQKQGREVASYQWSGYVLATLLPFLDEQGLDLMKSEHDELSKYVSEKRQTTCFVLTNSHKKHLPQLQHQSFSEAALRDYYNEFNRTTESDIGKAMLDGIQVLNESLKSVDENSVVILLIG